MAAAFQEHGLEKIGGLSRLYTGPGVIPQSTGNPEAHRTSISRNHSIIQVNPQ